MAQTLTEIKSLLAAHGLRPRYRFGQNFLHDANQMARILAAAELKDSDRVLEVGPGTGALSERLLGAGARLVMVEIDRDLAPILQERVLDRWPNHATLLIADVLAGKHEINPAVWEAMSSPLSGAEPQPGEGTPDQARGARADSASPRAPSPGDEYAAILSRARASPAGRGGPFKLIANLPYNVASPLIANLVLDHPEMSLAVVMIQREVADRLTAPPGGKDYGPLGVLVQAACEVERVAVLTPGCFWPAPKVDSAVVRLRRREKPLTADLPALSRILHTLFSKRRKQIGAILGRATPLPAGIDPRARPEQLTVGQLIALADRWRAERKPSGAA